MAYFGIVGIVCIFFGIVFGIVLVKPCLTFGIVGIVLDTLYMTEGIISPVLG